MKKGIILLLLILTTGAFAQKNFQGKATYMSKTSMDFSRFGRQMTEQRKKQMMARFKNFLEKDYTLSFNQSESSFKQNAKLNAPGQGGNSRWGSSNGQGSIYKNLKDKEMIEDVELFSKRFLVKEEMEQPKWELTGETKQIGNYTCFKATMTKVDKSIDWGNIFRRRGRRNNQQKDSTKTSNKEKTRTLNVTAWYTPQIPISAGPAEYWGLPGLILELNAGRTTMLCTEIVINPEEGVAIKAPTKGKEVTREEYNKIVKEKSKEASERFRRRRGNGRGGRRG